MTRLLSIAAPFVFSLASFGAQALTLEPLPGSTPQTTCTGCFFPHPVGVIVRDDAGNPMPFVPVTFSIPALDGVQAVPDTSEFPGGLFGPMGYAVAKADANGIATSPALTANGVQGSASGGATPSPYRCP